MTYKSGGRSTQIDFLLVRREEMKEVTNCKVLPGDSTASQHRALLMDIWVKGVKREQEVREPKTRWWKLKEEGLRSAFKERVMSRLKESGEKGLGCWQEIADKIREQGKQVLGRTPGKKPQGKET